HAGTAIHPRAGHFHLRTLEVLRAVGLEEQVRARSVEQYDPNGGIKNVESLAGAEISHFVPNLNEGVEQSSPSVRANLATMSTRFREGYSTADERDDAERNRETRRRVSRLVSTRAAAYFGWVGPLLGAGGRPVARRTPGCCAVMLRSFSF